MPLDSAVANTVISGAISSAARNSREMPISSQRSRLLSQVSRPGRELSSASMAWEGPPAI